MNKRYRADFPAWILFGGLSLFPWLIVWLNSARGLDIKSLLVAAILSGLAFAFLGSFKIMITPTELVFRSLFRGSQIIKHHDIKAVRLDWRFGGTKGPLRLVVESREGTNMERLDINAKFFSRAAIDDVLALGSRVGEADDNGLRDGVVLKTLRSSRDQK
jgi:hypothetical protein